MKLRVINSNNLTP